MRRLEEAQESDTCANMFWVYTLHSRCDNGTVIEFPKHI